jgi:hypothetical protein
MSSAGKLKQEISNSDDKVLKKLTRNDRNKRADRQCLQSQIDLRMVFIVKSQHARTEDNIYVSDNLFYIHPDNIKGKSKRKLLTEKLIMLFAWVSFFWSGFCNISILITIYSILISYLQIPIRDSK